MSHTILRTCSPRIDGNTDTVGITLVNQFNNALLPTKRISLRSLNSRPCTPCCFCITHPKQYHLESQDEAGLLFNKIRVSYSLIIASPIFFYGPPTQRKNFIDRSQKYWNEKNYILYNTQNTRNPLLKQTFVTLSAAKKKGTCVVNATLLILKCFFQCNWLFPL